jgi:hypothetical protein
MTTTPRPADDDLFASALAGALLGGPFGFGLGCVFGAFLLGFWQGVLLAVGMAVLSSFAGALVALTKSKPN